MSDDIQMIKFYAGLAMLGQIMGRGDKPLESDDMQQLIADRAFRMADKMMKEKEWYEPTQN